MAANTRFTEYAVMRIAGQSTAGGDPDDVANTSLANWGLQAADGNPSNLFREAVPAADYRALLKIKIWVEGQETRCSLFMDTRPVVMSLDRGKITSRKAPADSRGCFEMVMQGNYIYKMTLECGPVLEQSVPAPASAETSVLSPAVDARPERQEGRISIAENSDGTKVIGQILAVPWGLVRIMEGQPRKYFEPEALKEFGEALKEQGQLQPAIVKELPAPDSNGCIFELISGERRWRACQISGIPHLLIIINKVANSRDQFEKAIIANCHDVELSLLETMQAVGRLHDFGRSDAEIAKIFGKRSEQWAYKHRRALTLDVEVLKLLGPETPEENRILLSSAEPLIGLPVAEQIKYARMISRSGVSAKKVKWLVRQVREEYGLLSRDRPDEEFQAVLKFFREANTQIEILADHSDQHLAELFKGREPEQVSRLISHIKDCRDNLSTVLKVFMAEGLKNGQLQKQIL